MKDNEKIVMEEREIEEDFENITEEELKEWAKDE